MKEGVRHRLTWIGAVFVPVVAFFWVGRSIQWVADDHCTASWLRTYGSPGRPQNGDYRTFGKTRTNGQESVSRRIGVLKASEGSFGRTYELSLVRLRHVEPRGRRDPTQRLTHR
jgi:hypothetical protein